MQIVIDIPEEVKKAFDNANKDDICGCFYDYNSVIGKAIKNGILLPKEHGDLVDLKEVIGAFWDGNFMEIYEDDLAKINVIVKADKEINE